MTATVISGTNNIFEVRDGSGQKHSHVSLKGKILKTDERFYNALAPGDTVLLDESEKQITGFCERKNYFYRWNAKKNRPQILASNIDYVAVVASCKTPPFHPRFIDRVLVSASVQKIPALILINKIDLLDASDDFFSPRLQVWKSLGYNVFPVSAKEKKGFAEFAKIIAGKRIALLGQSGAGKSSIINAMAGNEMQTTGRISKKYERGTHTTTQGVLLSFAIDEKMPGESASNGSLCTEIIDTPGIRQLVLRGVSSRDLLLHFPEFKTLSCAFGMKCTHTHEAGCAILDAVKNNRASRERYEAYLRIRNEIETYEKTYE